VARISAILDHPTVKRVTDLVFKVIPVAGLVSLAAYVTAQQAVSPHRRVIKLGILLGLMAFMLRFDMVYSVYLFTILFPFPSGVTIGSTNSVLMTLIPLIWAVRAASTKSSILLRNTKVNFPIALFLFAYVLSFFNVESSIELTWSLKIMWRTVAAVMYFFMIVTFVNDEVKIMRLTKVLCGVSGFVMFTAIIELFFPGASIIPGWVGLSTRVGEGDFAYRIEGIRVGGAFGSHGMLSDFGTQTFFLMVYHAIRSRNPLEKTIWGGIALLTVVAIMATANRGAGVGFAIGVFYFFYLFRHRISVTKMAVIFGGIVVLLAVTETLLTRYTYAVSLSDRFITTSFEGVVPNNRVGTWAPAFKASLDHPFIGHGPHFQLEGGLEGLAWPHNGYIFYMYTIGMLGLLAFLGVVFRVWQYSWSFKLPGAAGTDLGDISRILHIILTVMLVEQLRTDHQRDDIYPFIVWLEFGLITATALVIRERSPSRSAADEAAGGGGGTGGGARRFKRPLGRYRTDRGR
jgi:O-antigen ligase